MRLLRERLQRAVAQERFGEAAGLRDEVRIQEEGLLLDPETGLYVAHDAFYAALRTGDAAMMGGLWLESESVSCADSRQGLVVGYAAVVARWKMIFEGGVGGVEMEVLRVGVGRNMGWVVSRQRVERMRGGLSIGGERIATGVYQRRAGRWWMVHYDASPVAG